MQIDLNNLAAVLAAVAERFPTTVSAAEPSQGGIPEAMTHTSGGLPVPITDADSSLELLDGTLAVVNAGPSAGIDEHLAAVDAHLQRILEISVTTVADAAWLPVIDSLEYLRRRLSAVYLRSLAAADQVHAAVLSPLGTRTMADYLKHGPRIEPSRAKADIAAARALHTATGTGTGALTRQAEVNAGPLRAMVPALESGSITGAHVATGVGVLEKLPNRLLTEANTEAIGAFLVRQAPVHSSRRFAEIAAYLVRTCEPAADDHYDPEAFLRRKLTMGVDITGMVFGSYQLDPAAGAEFRAILDPLAAPTPDQRNPDGSIAGTDGRTADQRRADAVVELARAAAAYLGMPTGPPSPVQTTTADGAPEGAAQTAGSAGIAESAGRAGDSTGGGAIPDGGPIAEGSTGMPDFPGPGEDDSGSREAAAAARAEDLFGLRRTTPAGAQEPAGARGQETATGPQMAGGSADAGGGEGATSCGPSKASRLRPGRRSARVTITTTFDQLRTTTEPPAAGTPAPRSQPPDWRAFAPVRSAEIEPLKEREPSTSSPAEAEPADETADMPRASLRVTKPEPAAEPEWQPFGGADTSGDAGRAVPDTGRLRGNRSGSGIGWPVPAQPESNPDWLGATGSATGNGWPAAPAPESDSAWRAPAVPGSQGELQSTNPTAFPAAGPGGPSYPRDPSPSYSDQLGPISSGTLARLACDASFERAVLDAKGAILELGQGIRLASPAQRRAVSVRDGGCARPGCNRPASWCDIHHIIWYSRGGPTDIANLAGFCPADHSLIHAGILETTMIDGIPYVRYGPNARIRTMLNPYQSANTNDWTRNTYFDDLKEAKNLARIIISAA